MRITFFTVPGIAPSHSKEGYDGVDKKKNGIDEYSVDRIKIVGYGNDGYQPHDHGDDPYPRWSEMGEHIGCRQQNEEFEKQGHP